MLKKFDKETILKLTDSNGIETEVTVVINILKPIEMLQVLGALCKDFEVEVIEA